MQSGLTHIYTGDGKGKTTSALGLCLRALGAGKRVCLVQFLKKGEFSEIKALRKFPNFEVAQFGTGKFVDPGNVSIQDRALAISGLVFTKKALLSVRYDLLVLDEVLVALKFGILELEAVIDLVASKPPSTELVLTGRGAPRELIDAADLVSNIEDIKHPFQKGIKARVGIEY